MLSAAYGLSLVRLEGLMYISSSHMLSRQTEQITPQDFLRAYYQRIFSLAS